MVIDAAAAKKRTQLLKNLPTLPDMIDQISKAVESERFSAADIGKLISRDQVLTAKVLKLANSAFFGRSRRVGSLTQALVLLGFDVVKGLILTSSVFGPMKDQAQDMWKHSWGVAAAAGVIAREVAPDQAEEASLAGLLHDLGKVVIRVHMPEDSALIQKLAGEEGLSVREAERTILGFSHARVGKWLAESWKLPEELTDPLRWHHQPENAQKSPLLTAVVHLADILARGYGLGDGKDIWTPPLNRRAMARLDLNSRKLQNIVKVFCEKMAAGGGVGGPA